MEGKLPLINYRILNMELGTSCVLSYKSSQQCLELDNFYYWKLELRDIRNTLSSKSKLL